MATPRTHGWNAFALAVLGAAAIGYSIQIRTYHGRASRAEFATDPAHKVFVAGWLASQLWVNPVLFVAGVAVVLGALGYLLVAWRRARCERNP